MTYLREELAIWKRLTSAGLQIAAAGVLGWMLFACPVLPGGVQVCRPPLDSFEDADSRTWRMKQDFTRLALLRQPETERTSERVGDTIRVGTRLTSPPGSRDVPLEISKSSSPLDYTAANYPTPDLVVQWSSDEQLSTGQSRDAHLFRADISGDGNVQLDESPSGGISTSTWRGLVSAVNKSGDASAHSFTAIGSLGKVGPVGYNEFGLFIGTGTNVGSWRGTVHGTELLTRDGTARISDSGTVQSAAPSTVTLAPSASDFDDAYKDLAIEITAGEGAGQFRRITGYHGATKVATVSPNWRKQPSRSSQYRVFSAFDTFLANHIARNARYFGGARQSYSFYASAEGRVQNTAILYGVNSGTASNGWNYGVDFRDLTFGTSAIALRSEQGIAWQLADHSGIANVMLVDGADHLVLKTPRHVKKLLIKSTDGTVLAEFDAAHSAGNPFSAVFGGSLRQLTAGPEDSGGEGFRILRVAN